MRKSLFSLLVLSLFFVSACSSRIVLDEGFETDNSVNVVILEVSSSDLVKRETISEIRFLLRESLRYKGYKVLGSDFLRKSCGKNCEDRGSLIKEHNITYFIKLKIDPLSKNNFLLGFYHYLSGTLLVSDVDDRVILKKEATIRRSGGLLFESGRILQGLIDQVEESSDSTIDQLYFNLVYELVKALPDKSTSRAYLPKSDLRIDKVYLSEFNENNYKICMEGAKDFIARLILPARRPAEIKEISDGIYCGVFPKLLLEEILKLGSDQSLKVELNDPFGNVKRKVVLFSGGL